MAINAAWVWVSDRLTPDAVRRFVGTHQLREAWVSVPWTGVDVHTQSIVRALKTQGIAVHALGGDPQWAIDPILARTWATRAHDSNSFAGTHLDIEPWTLPTWGAAAEMLLVGIAHAASEVASIAPGVVNVDLAPWIVGSHPARFSTIASAVDEITLMSYRNTANGILTFSQTARTALRSAGCRYRLAVDTRPSPDPKSSFARLGAARLARECATVERNLPTDPAFRGFAVHDLSGWLTLPATAP